MTREEIYQGVSDVLTESLEVDPRLVTPEASLARDLGADSLDVMDIVVRLNRRFSLKLSARELGDQLRESGMIAIAGEVQASENHQPGPSVSEQVSRVADATKTVDLVTVNFLVGAVEHYLQMSPGPRS